MALDLARLIVALAVAYILAGVVFAIPFVVAGARRLDPSARGASLGFHVLILPGSAALWPLLLWRVIRAGGAPRPGRDGREETLMTRHHRRVHRGLFVALTILLPPMLILALAWRAGSPAAVPAPDVVSSPGEPVLRKR